MAEKKCTKCGEVKPLDQFHRQIDCKGGRRPDCMVCHNLHSHVYNQKNSEQLRQWHRNYRRQHIEEIRSKDREYYRANKERWVLYDKRRRLMPNFSSAASATQKRWRTENKDQVNVWTRNRRAKIKALGGKHTLADIRNLMESQRGKCVYCRCDIRKKFQVDHIVPVSAGGANDKSNLQLLCRKCNLDKHAKDPFEFQKERGMLL